MLSKNPIGCFLNFLGDLILGPPEDDPGDPEEEEEISEEEQKEFQEWIDSEFRDSLGG
jgi:hypothetical protein